ncbi:N-acetylglucosamine-6-phosphate deacetylase [Jeotgalibacillus terrae]|uniref:N-acetylglucosamine-6-phosphate deacetylase n=1 Tax=Jeotgalibacillus terrae TaxID=587735 RepID=A0ABW5ZCH3_9BACL|nr:N-acetylglucosamine-6-phosphate deacetylase [Jeotgalibacillus terrae]MBM7580132.1 N-acetylglucosamine-6-phosphate deacetylase [Jeotgalibacillus terrae]
MTKKILRGASIYAEGSNIRHGSLFLEGSKIVGMSESVTDHSKDLTDDTEIINLKKEWTIIPGFIDLHIHGLENVDVMDGNIKSISKMQKHLPKEGTTSFLATTMTQHKECITQAMKAVKKVMSEDRTGAEILGIHLEGPFISKDKAGAQPVEHISPIDADLFDYWNHHSGNNIRIVTFAPELPGASAFTRHLVSQGIISSFGHSNASYSIASEMIDEGGSQGTHLFNQMSPIHHRDVGLAGALLLDRRCYTEVIADGIHISKEAVQFIYALKPRDKIVLVTDSMRAKGLCDGDSELGGQKIIVKNGQATLESGTLAGSTLTMSEAFKNIIEFTGCSFEEAISFCSFNPAVRLGLESRKGSIKTGKDADLIILDENKEIVMTFCRGVCEYERD